MKLTVNILLFIFISFLSTPTIVSMIEKSCDTSYFFSMSEEELTHKEIKAEFRLGNELSIGYFQNKSSSLILSENLSKHDNISSAIFIPPPEQM